MKTLFLFALIASSLYLNAQTLPAKAWDFRFGGDGEDYLTNLVIAHDSGYLLAGHTTTINISGDVSEQAFGVSSHDVWIVKVNKDGIKEWERRYGGDDADFLKAVLKTSDGYLLAGSTTSLTGSQVSQPPKGHMDYWIVKIDSLGNPQWDQRFGGDNYDELLCAATTSDGGYILGGMTGSGQNGDISDTSRGLFDGWIVKVDAQGNKLWDKRFGGNQHEWQTGIAQMPDGGYLLSSYTQSDISGDITQPTLGGGYDGWILKTDSLGNKLWDKRIGGAGVDELLSMTPCTQGYALLGFTDGLTVLGDTSRGLSDYWLTIIDSAANILWSRRYGGAADEDDLGYIRETSDGGFLISGTSYSQMSGDKTQHNMGREQSWIVRTDSLGNLIWDRTLRTAIGGWDDEVGFAVQQGECYIMANSTVGDGGGDKTQASRGLGDYWIIKFCQTTDVRAFYYPSAEIICPGECISFYNQSINGVTYEWVFNGATPSYETTENPVNICYPNAGTYDAVLIAHGNGMTDTIHQQVFVHSQPSTLITANHDTICSGDSTLICAKNGFADYSWNTGQSLRCIYGSAAGNYYVTLTDYNGCTAESNRLALTTYPTTAVSLTVNGDTLTTQNGVAYQWYLNGFAISGATSPSYVAESGGYYSVLITDSNGCQIISNNVLISGFEDETYGNLRIIPNPFYGEVTIVGLEEVRQIDIRVSNPVGQLLLENKNMQVGSNKELRINLSLLPSGLYYVQINANNLKRTLPLMKL